MMLQKKMLFFGLILLQKKKRSVNSSLKFYDFLLLFWRNGSVSMSGPED